MTYLRLVFTIYWQDMSPSSTELFLQSSMPSVLTLTEINSASDQALAMARAHAEAGAVAKDAILIDIREVDMTTEEIEAAGWRIMATAAP